MALEILVNTGSGNGLLPDSIKPLPEPTLTFHLTRSSINHSRVMFTGILKISILKLCLKLKLHLWNTSLKQGWGEYRAYEYEYWKISTQVVHQTLRKLWSFYQTEEGYWPDFKHDNTQEFYRSYSVFTGKCPRSSKFRGVWYTSSMFLLYSCLSFWARWVRE